MSRRPSPALLVAFLALIVALAGTAVAAEQYVITSTSQIKPSVLKELQDLRATAHAAVVEPPRSIVARDYTLGSIATGAPKEAVTDPLAPATWTQQSNELNGLAGTAEVTVGAGCEQQFNHVEIDVSVPGWNGESAGSYDNEDALIGDASARSGEVPKRGEVIKTDLVGTDGTAWTLFGPGKPTTRTLAATVTMQGAVGCHFTVDYISIAVIGAR